jgi:hypothetical protein
MKLTNILKLLVVSLLITNILSKKFKKPGDNFLKNPKCFVPDPKAYYTRESWQLYNGSGEIQFTGTGRDVYIRIHDGKDRSQHLYWIVINGWENKNSRITRGDGSFVCYKATDPLDLTKKNTYNVKLDQQTSSITVSVNGELHFQCTDKDGWQPEEARTFSISRYHQADFKICDVHSEALKECECQKHPLEEPQRLGLRLDDHPNYLLNHEPRELPEDLLEDHEERSEDQPESEAKPEHKANEICFAPNSMGYRWANDWTVSESEPSEIRFKGVGRDVYVQLSNQMDEVNYQYWIVINGWLNTRSRISRGDAATSIVCHPKVKSIDVNIEHEYRIIVNPKIANIQVFIDDEESFNCTDEEGWYGYSKHFGISKYHAEAFKICEISSKTLTEAELPRLTAHECGTRNEDSHHEISTAPVASGANNNVLMTNQPITIVQITPGQPIKSETVEPKALEDESDKKHQLNEILEKVAHAMPSNLHIFEQPQDAGENEQEVEEAQPEAQEEECHNKQKIHQILNDLANNLPEQLFGGIEEPEGGFLRSAHSEDSEEEPKLPIHLSGSGIPLELNNHHSNVIRIPIHHGPTHEERQQEDDGEEENGFQELMQFMGNHPRPVHHGIAEGMRHGGIHRNINNPLENLLKGIEGDILFK